MVAVVLFMGDQLIRRWRPVPFTWPLPCHCGSLRATSKAKRPAISDRALYEGSEHAPIPVPMRLANERTQSGVENRATSRGGIGILLPMQRPKPRRSA